VEAAPAARQKGGGILAGFQGGNDAGRHAFGELASRDGQNSILANQATVSTTIVAMTSKTKPMRSSKLLPHYPMPAMQHRHGRGRLTEAAIGSFS